MHAQCVLDALRSRGATFEVSAGGRLCVEVGDGDELDDTDVEMIRQHKAGLIELIRDREVTDTDADYDLNERAAIQEEGCTLTVQVTASDLLETLRAKGAGFSIHPGGVDVVAVELSDIDAMLVRRHNVMLSRWALQARIRRETGIKVEIAEWSGGALPECEPPERRPRHTYQVVPSELGAPSPELEGLWALIFDHPPRLYRSPWRAAQEFLRTWNRHQATIRRYRRFGKLRPAEGLAATG